MNNEKEKKEKNTVNKVLPWITLILSITMLIQVIISIFQYLREVNPVFWEKFFFWFSVIPLSTAGVFLIGVGILYFIEWLRHKDKWKNREKIAKEFDQKIKNEIRYEELESIGEEIIEILPIFLEAEIEGINSFYWHMGLEISIWKPITKRGKFELSEDEEEFVSYIYLCKFTQPDKRTLDIVGSPHITEWIAKDIQMLSAEIRMWEIIFEPLVAMGWEKIILCSTWKNKKYIRKYCLHKDNTALVYSIEMTDTACKLVKR